MEIKRIIYNDEHFALYSLSNDDKGYYWDYVNYTHDYNSVGDYPRIRTNDVLLVAMPFYEEQLHESST